MAKKTQTQETEARSVGRPNAFPGVDRVAFLRKLPRETVSRIKAIADAEDCTDTLDQLVDAALVGFVEQHAKRAAAAAKRAANRKPRKTTPAPAVEAAENA